MDPGARVEPKNLPVVVIVHGGPWSRDFIEWDPEVQVLANRGFAVLQVNFRGSTGFGKELLEAGYREWGQKVQDDISDDKWYDWGYEWHQTMVGGERGDQERLRQASPLRNVANVTAPILLGHGEDDQRVHVRQSRRMAEALRKAGKEVQYLEFPNEIHDFLLEANRVQWYEALVAFFEKNLTPRVRPASP